MRFFFYGTLMDRDVLAYVLGRPVQRDAMRPASLDGYRRTAIREGSYPVIVRDKAGRVDGIAFDGVSAAESQRLANYEGERYDLVQVFAELPGQGKRVVFVFEPRPDAFQPTGTEWLLADWQATHKEKFLAAIRRVDYGEPRGGNRT